MGDNSYLPYKRTLKTIINPVSLKDACLTEHRLQEQNMEQCLLNDWVHAPLCVLMGVSSIPSSRVYSGASDMEAELVGGCVVAS